MFSKKELDLILEALDMYEIAMQALLGKAAAREQMLSLPDVPEMAGALIDTVLRAANEDRKKKKAIVMLKAKLLQLGEEIEQDELAHELFGKGAENET